MKRTRDNSSQLPRIASEISPNIELHHGGLRQVAGVHSRQVIRADRHGSGAKQWTYNHAPMLAHWNGQFYLQYLSNPVSEHVPPGRTLLTTSQDGTRWSEARVLFDQYPVDSGNYPGVDPELTKSDTWAVMHQRMGFYTAPQGRLLTLGFYGFSPTPVLPPFERLGIGRVVREIYRDNSWGPVYFIYLNTAAGWTEANTPFPWYERSGDSGFVEACNALLADRLATQQWCEEHGPEDPHVSLKGRYKALSYYTLADGRVVGVWKWSLAGITADRGETWQEVAEVPSIETAGGKVWGQRTSDGKYALLYTPSTNNQHRWPLALTVSDDGLDFGELCCAVGDVSPRRYAGSHKDFGLNYIRGIAEGNGDAPDGDLWVTYSMNKEDIWISRITVPIRTRVESHASDDFSHGASERVMADWTTFSPQRAAVTFESDCLLIRDDDPYEYARADRPFPESSRVRVHVDVSAADYRNGSLYLEVLDPHGRVPLRLLWDSEHTFNVHHGRGLTSLCSCEPDRKYAIDIDIDTELHRFAVSVDGQRTGTNQVYNGEQWSLPLWYFLAPVRSVSRLVLRTKPVRREPTVDTPCDLDTDLPYDATQRGPCVFRLYNVSTAPLAKEQALL